MSIAGHDGIAVMLASLLYLVLRRLLTLVAPKHRSDDGAQIEILVLRHQLRVLRRQVKRPVYRHMDRALLAAASRIGPTASLVRIPLRTSGLGRSDVLVVHAKTDFRADG